jgi:hypothetical protein
MGSGTVFFLLWILLLIVPGLAVHGPKRDLVVLAIVFGGCGASLALLAGGVAYAERTTAAPIPKPDRSEGAEAFSAAIRSWTRVPLLVLFATELAIIARIRELGEHCAWLTWFDRLQSVVTHTASVVIPAVARVPDVLLAEMAVPHRADLIQDCLAWGHLAAILAVLGTGRATLRLLSRKAVLPNAGTAAPLNEARRWLLSAIGTMMAGVFLFSTGIDDKYNRRELFQNFESNDVDLVYRATFGPLAVAAITVMVLLVVIRSYRGLD